MSSIPQDSINLHKTPTHRMLLQYCQCIYLVLNWLKPGPVSACHISNTLATAPPKSAFNQDSPWQQYPAQEPTRSTRRLQPAAKYRRCHSEASPASIAIANACGLLQHPAIWDPPRNPVPTQVHTACRKDPPQNSQNVGIRRRHKRTQGSVTFAWSPLSLGTMQIDRHQKPQIKMCEATKSTSKARTHSY